MIEITLTGTNPSKYYIELSNEDECPVLGRRWDNISEAIKVNKPEAESSSSCTMYVTYKNRYIDAIIVGSDPINIQNNISQFEWVDISFSFTRADGYVKNSEIKRFYFADAIKPKDFVPEDPTVLSDLQRLIASAFCFAQYEDNTLSIYTLSGALVFSAVIDSTPELECVTAINTVVEGDAFYLVVTATNLKTLVESSSNIRLQLASSAEAGLMSSESYTDLQNAKSDIGTLQNKVNSLEGQTVRLLYTDKADPTPEEIEQFVIDSGYANTSLWSKIAVVVQATKHIWHYYRATDQYVDDDISIESGSLSDLKSIVDAAIAQITLHDEFKYSIFINPSIDGFQINGACLLNAIIEYLDDEDTSFTETLPLFKVDYDSVQDHYVLSVNGLVTDFGVQSINTSIETDATLTLTGDVNIVEFDESWQDDGVDTVSQFTNSSPGVIKGSSQAGYVNAQNDGTGKVNGFDDKLNKKNFSNNPQTWVDPSTFITDQDANKHRILAGIYVVDEDGNQVIIPFSMAGGARQDGYPEGTSTDPNGPPLGVPTPVMYNSANQILCCKATDAKHTVPLGQLQDFLAGKLDKVAATSANARKLYGTNNAGGSYMWKVLRSVAEMQTADGGVMGRADNGHFVVPTPTANDDIANKGYVDNKAVAKTGTSNPTTSTEGYIGQLYLNTSTNTLWHCTAIAGSTYTWTQVTTPVDVNSIVSAISSSGDPTTSNVGYLGQFYFNTVDNSIWQCVDITGGVYTWRKQEFVEPNLKLVFTTTAANASITLRYLTNMTLIDWGDGTKDATLSHTYAVAGTYNCKIYGVTDVGGQSASIMQAGSNYLKEVYFGDVFTKVGAYAFRSFSYLTKVVLSNNTTSIDSYAFASTSNLYSIEFPNKITQIQGHAFDSSALRTVKWPTFLYSFSNDAFNGCYYLEELDLSSCINFSQISNRAFKGCTSLRSVILPHNCSSIQESAFENCTALRTVEAMVRRTNSRSFGNYAFKGCSNLKYVSIDDYNACTFGTDCFLNTNASLQIYVKDNLLEGYKTTYTAYASNFVSCITQPLIGSSDPTTSTMARYLGQLYINTSTNATFICTAMADPTYTWVAVGGGPTWTAVNASSVEVTEGLYTFVVDVGSGSFTATFTMYVKASVPGYSTRIADDYANPNTEVYLTCDPFSYVTAVANAISGYGSNTATILGYYSY